jgi:PAS domain S-box-containing protein
MKVPISGLKKKKSVREIPELNLKEELIASEVRYRRLFESAKDGILILDAETGKILDVNPFLIELLGYSKESFIEKDIWEIGFFTDIAANKEKLLKLQQEEYVRYDNLPLETSAGRKINVEFVSNVYLVNNHKVIQCNIRDITERKRSEEEIAMLAHSLKSINECVSITDLEDKITFINESFLRTYGYEENELIGKHISIVRSHNNDPDIVQKILPSTIKGEWHGELLNRRKDGSEFPVYLSTTLIKGKDNKILGLIGVAIDITGRKQAEKELIEAREKAEESDRLKSAFLANMSHEIRTPMNGILGFTELLKTPMLTGEEQNEYISIIEKSGLRMLNIINDIINISKVESGQMEISMSDANVNEQIEYIYNFFKPIAEQKKLKLTFRNSLPSEMSYIRTDREKVLAVLTNLVNNAIKFTEKGFIDFGYEMKGKYLEFFVKDTGIGIRHDLRELIFERFRQGSDALIRNYEGSGLGLSISKAYVEMLGGNIRVESDPFANMTSGVVIPSGSTFYFTIPYNTEQGKQAAGKITETASEAREKIRNLKILIVEDDEISERLITITSERISKDSIKVKTGVEAVEACRHNPDIDLILMDVKLPEMDGYEATRQIRKFNKKVIIIAQTAYGMISDRNKALAAGCNDYISKPFTNNMLKNMMIKHFRENENRIA